MREGCAVPEERTTTVHLEVAPRQIGTSEAFIDLGKGLLHRCLFNYYARQIQVVLHEHQQRLLGQSLLRHTAGSKERACMREDAEPQWLLACH